MAEHTAAALADGQPVQHVVPAGFVRAGRSLREVELREDTILHLALPGWIVILVVVSAIVYIFRFTPQVPTDQSY
jgi:hypothetical protein